MNQSQKKALAIGGVIAAALFVLTAALLLWWWQSGGYGMMGPGMMGGFSTAFLMPILWIVVLGFIIWAVAAASNRPDESGGATHKGESPMDIIKRRYAEGEIGKEEYEEKKKDLI